MGTLIELLANRKKPAAPPTETAVPLPVLQKEHEGECGEACGCGDSAHGCCGG